MDTWLVYLHNILRWIILILLLASIINSFAGWQGKKSLTASTAKLWTFTMVSNHINLLIGLYLLLFGRFGIVNTTLPAGTNIMKDSFYRFYWVEHPVTMIIAIVLITLGR